MRIRLILKEILPFYLRLAVLAAVTLFIDLILHLTDLVWIGGGVKRMAPPSPCR